MTKFLDRLKPKSIEELESDLTKINAEFTPGRFDTLMGEAYDLLDKAIEHADVNLQYGKVKKKKDVEDVYNRRLGFLRALKTLKPHWKATKE